MGDTLMNMVAYLCALAFCVLLVFFLANEINSRIAYKESEKQYVDSMPQNKADFDGIGSALQDEQIIIEEIERSEKIEDNRTESNDNQKSDLHLAVFSSILSIAVLLAIVVRNRWRNIWVDLIWDMKTLSVSKKIKKIKTNVNCYMIISESRWITYFSIAVPLCIYSVYRYFTLINNLQMEREIPEYCFLLFIIAVTVFIFFMLLKTLPSSYYTYKFIKLLIYSDTGTFYLADIKKWFGCDVVKADEIVKKVLYGGFFQEMYYDPFGKIIFFTSKKSKTYADTVTDKQQLTPEVIGSREDIAKIQSASMELKEAVKKYKKSDKKDNRIKKALSDIIETLDRIQAAMTYNMENNIDVHKLYTYYIPTLCKLIRNYCRYSDLSVKGNEVLKEHLLEAIISTEAMLTQICMEINENDELDLDVEMSTMQAVMSADGYDDHVRIVEENHLPIR